MKYSVEGNSFPVAICELEAGESLVCEGGAMSWMSPNMRMETISKGKAGKVMGLFNTVISGPGHIWLQTMPIARTARTISRYLPIKSD